MLPSHLQLPATLVDRPWSIAKQRIPAFLQACAIRGAAIAQVPLASVEAAVLAASASPLGRLEGSVALIPVTGVITQKADFYSWWYGGTSVERLTSSFRTYLNDPNVSAIVFDVDSPGGEVYGVPEFFEEVFAARGKKTLISVSNPFMASAAYWLGCACDEVYLMPSGQAGSVGCYTMHTDVSAMLKTLGVAVTFIQHGEHKTEGNPYEPLSDPAHAELQASVDHYGSMFDKGVAKARGIEVEDVLDRFGQGRVLRANQAKKVGMVDKIGTLDDALVRLNPKRSRAGLVAHLGAAVPAAVVETPAPVATAAATETAKLNDDGTCPDGYEKGDDGQCHLESDDSKAQKAQARVDGDAAAVTLTVLAGAGAR